MPTKAAKIPFWPCPHGCLKWARAWNPRTPQTNHHPQCEHVDASMIPVWKVSDGQSFYFTDNEADAKTEAKGCEDITITKTRMHREIYDQLPEFGGF